MSLKILVNCGLFYTSPNIICQTGVKRADKVVIYHKLVGQNRVFNALNEKESLILVEIHVLFKLLIKLMFKQT